MTDQFFPGPPGYIASILDAINEKAREERLEKDALPPRVADALKQLIQKVRPGVPPADLDEELSPAEVLSICKPRHRDPLENRWQPRPLPPREVRAWKIFGAVIDYAAKYSDDPAVRVALEWSPFKALVALSQSVYRTQAIVKLEMMIRASELCSRRKITKAQLEYIVLYGGLPAYYFTSPDEFVQADYNFLRYATTARTVPLDLCYFKLYDVWDYERSKHGKETLRFRKERLVDLQVLDLGWWIYQSFPNMRVGEVIDALRRNDDKRRRVGDEPWFDSISDEDPRERRMRKILAPVPFNRKPGRSKKERK
jgi:hypothetical protein